MISVKYGKNKSGEEMKELERVMRGNYLKLKNTFTLLASHSSYPTLSMNEITQFVRKSHLFGKEINLAKMD